MVTEPVFLIASPKAFSSQSSSTLNSGWLDFKNEEMSFFHSSKETS
jgi:hypothetical protein